VHKTASPNIQHILMINITKCDYIRILPEDWELPFVSGITAVAERLMMVAGVFKPRIRVGDASPSRSDG
jgi:hypothetical protein